MEKAIRSLMEIEDNMEQILKKRKFGIAIARVLCPAVLETGQEYKREEIIQLIYEYYAKVLGGSVERKKVALTVKSFVKDRNYFERLEYYQGDRGYYRYIGSNPNHVTKHHLEEDDSNASIMVENTKLSTAILEVIADTKSYPVCITQNDIINNNAIKENFGSISIGTIVFHIKMLEEAGLIEAEFRDRVTFDGTTRFAKIIGLTKQGSDHIKYIRSPFWDKAMQELKSADKPLTIQLIFSVCDKLIRRFK